MAAAREDPVDFAGKDDGAGGAASEAGPGGASNCAKIEPDPSPTRWTGLKDDDCRARGYRESRRWQSSLSMRPSGSARRRGLAADSLENSVPALLCVEPVRRVEKRQHIAVYIP